MSAEKIAAEVAIIGSGVAGALTAWELASLGVRNIVVLEAGPRIDRDTVVGNFTKSAASGFSGGYPNEAHAPRPDWEAKNPAYIRLTGKDESKNEYLRVVGGTTWHWSGSTPRLHPHDFSTQTRYGRGTDWPLDYKTLAPFYAAAEAELGVAGDANVDDGSPRDAAFPMPPVPLSYCDSQVAAALATLGIRCFSRPVARATKAYRGRSQCMGFGTCMPVCPSGAQYAGIVHVEAAEKLGVRVIENARVDRIVARDRVTELQARRPNGDSLAVTAKIYVLAANGVESPRLLLMSAGEGAPRGIANSSGQVGRNYMDHPTLIAGMLMPKPVWQGRGPATIMASHDFRDGDFRRDRPAWLLSTDNRPHTEDVTAELIAKGVAPPDLDAAILDRASRVMHIAGGIEQLPDPANGITLDWSRRDAAGQPGIDLHYSLGDYETRGLDEMRTSFKTYEKAFGAQLLDTYGPFTAHHQVGMARMGDDPKQSVADSHGRCHDLHNLFIASGALFPSASCVNPTLTIAALALRSAAEIARQLKA